MAFTLRGPNAAEAHIDDLPPLLGTRFGPGEWHEVDEDLFDQFSDVTGDHAWYHVDRRRALAELPGGKTIAHGLLTLALVPALYSQVFRLGHAGRGLNYGYDRLRFIAPVRAGDRIRISVVPSEITPHARGRVVRVGLTVEIERDAQIALLGDQLLFVLRKPKVAAGDAEPTQEPSDASLLAALFKSGCMVTRVNVRSLIRQPSGVRTRWSS